MSRNPGLPISQHNTVDYYFAPFLSMEKSMHFCDKSGIFSTIFTSQLFFQAQKRGKKTYCHAMERGKIINCVAMRQRVMQKKKDCSSLQNIW